MSVEVISSGKAVAKKRHRCTWCGEWIEAGESYTKEFVKVGGDPSWNKLHPECDLALADLCASEGGSCEYTPYDNERPARTSNGNAP